MEDEVTFDAERACFHKSNEYEKDEIMKRTAVVASILSVLMGAAGVAPADAMPSVVPVANRTTDVLQARVVVKFGYWRGHRGFRYRRPGYRFYNGFWYPPAAFIIVKPRRGWYWCGPRYRRHRCWR